MFNYFLLALSLLFFLTGCIFALRMNATSRAIIIFISITATSLLAYSAFFLVSDYFTNNGVDDSVFYHLQYGLSGAGYEEYWHLILITAVFLMLAITVPYKLLHRFSVSNKEPSTNRRLWFIYPCIISSFVISPTTYGIIKYSQPGFTSLFSPVSIRDDFHEFYIKDGSGISVQYWGKVELIDNEIHATPEDELDVVIGIVPFTAKDGDVITGNTLDGEPISNTP